MSKSKENLLTYLTITIIIILFFVNHSVQVVCADTQSKSGISFTDPNTPSTKEYVKHKNKDNLPTTNENYNLIINFIGKFLILIIVIVFLKKLPEGMELTLFNRT